MKITSIFMLIIVASLATNESSVKEKWRLFKADFNKVYESPDQEAARYQNFKDNLNTIKEHNKKYNKGLVSYQLGITQFADMNEDDFSSYLKKLPRMSSTSDPHAKPFTPLKFNVPLKKDWRDNKVISGVKDETKHCYSSWAFSAAGAIESHLAILQNSTCSTLSPQNLIDCSLEDGNEGCKGGNISSAFHYVQNNGIMLEEDYPYTARQQNCSFNPNKSVTSISGYRKIPTGSEEKLQEVVGSVGPVAAGIHATRFFFLYRGGYFYDDYCSSNVNRLNRVVLIVGYSYENEKEYWIVKNSLGWKWGIEGYMHLARNKENNCGIATAAFYPLFS
ncbi:Peptidase C1 and/or Inhibitor I29 domain containing protein [Asbolus verrucosus]|uniref:Peptidase C1 and/or Inhibitor I29 domain containing protein n=1 Tax=Asbolus verrucosus TaxID=1661398 RepID=A0A482VR39_ASBVE|nr:Peptidase C1 and/or Inhibitor I29 domain containing protein [Asbolus verrucosus]